MAFKLVRGANALHGEELQQLGKRAAQENTEQTEKYQVRCVRLLFWKRGG